jgi:Domain of unknown function (DUF4259)
MSAWNTGPFDSDMAADFLDLLSELAMTEKEDELRELFAHAIRDPDGVESFLGLRAVVAGAALVAMCLPGGGNLLEQQKSNYSGDLTLVLPVPHDRHFVLAARDAVVAVTHPDRDWSRNWLSDDDQIEARRGVDDIVAILTDNVEGGV